MGGGRFERSQVSGSWVLGSFVPWKRLGHIGCKERVGSPQAQENPGIPGARAWVWAGGQGGGNHRLERALIFWEKEGAGGRGQTHWREPRHLGKGADVGTHIGGNPGVRGTRAWIIAGRGWEVHKLERTQVSRELGLGFGGVRGWREARCLGKRIRGLGVAHWREPMHPGSRGLG